MLEFLPIAPSGKGYPMPQWAQIAVGIALIVFALYEFSMLFGTRWRRSKWRWDGGGRMSRVSFAAWGTCAGAFGALMIGWVPKPLQMPIMFSAIGAVFLSGAVDSVRDSLRARRIKRERAAPWANHSADDQV